jgi:hypothetical protein
MKFLKNIALAFSCLLALNLSAKDSVESMAQKSTAILEVSGIVMDMFVEDGIEETMVKLVILNEDDQFVRDDSMLTTPEGYFKFHYKPQQLDFHEEYKYTLYTKDLCTDDIVTVENTTRPYYSIAHQMDICFICPVELTAEASGQRVAFELDKEDLFDFNTVYWDFGDGLYANDIESTRHYYSEAGEYEICISYETSFGCYNEICQTLFIEEDEKDLGGGNSSSSIGLGEKDAWENMEFIRSDNGNSISIVLSDYFTLKESETGGDSGSDIQPTKDMRYSVKLFSSNGQLLYQKVSSENILDLPKYNRGTYFLVINFLSENMTKSVPIIY